MLLLPRMLPIPSPVLRMILNTTTYLRVVMPGLLRVVKPGLLRVVKPGLLRMVMPNPTLGEAIQEMRLRVTILGLLLWIHRRRAMCRRKTQVCNIPRPRREARGHRHLRKGKIWPIWMTPCQSRVMVPPPRALLIPATGLIRMLRTAGTHMTLPIPVVQMRRMMSAESKSHSVL
jgi:hypothetical protein